MRGYFFTVFGIMAFIMPSITIATVVIAWGAHAFAYSVFRLFPGNNGRAPQKVPVTLQATGRYWR